MGEGGEGLGDVDVLDGHALGNGQLDRREVEDALDKEVEAKMKKLVKDLEPDVTVKNI